MNFKCHSRTIAKKIYQYMSVKTEAYKNQENHSALEATDRPFNTKTVMLTKGKSVKYPL